jgi:hypothetical protein
MYQNASTMTFANGERCRAIVMRGASRHKSTPTSAASVEQINQRQNGHRTLHPPASRRFYATTDPLLDLAIEPTH